MKFVLSVILFLGAVGVFTGLSRYSHRETVENDLRSRSLQVLKEAGLSRSLQILKEAGFNDVSVHFDHFDARLGGYVDNEEDKRYALALISDKVAGAFVPELKDVGIQIRPSIVPWVSVKKAKGVRVALLEGKLAIDAEEHQKYLGSSLYVINGVDSVKNDISLDPQMLPLDVATEFAALAAGLIPVSERSEIRYDENGVTIGGLVENEGVKKILIELAEKLAPGKVIDNLEVETRLASNNPAEFHLLRSRFGMSVSGKVPDLDTKAKLFGMLANGNGSRIGDNLDISSLVDKAFWADNAAKVVPLLLSKSNGELEIHYTARRVQIIGNVSSKDVSDAVSQVLAGLKKTHRSLEILSELKVTAEGMESAETIEIAMVFDQMKVTIDGKIPTETAKSEVISKIVKKSDKTQIINNLTIDEKLTSPKWLGGLPILLAEAVERISSGSIQVKNEEVTLSGMTHGIEEKQVIQNTAINLFPDHYKVLNLLTYTDQPFPAPDLRPGEAAKLTESLKALPVYFDMNSDDLKGKEVKKVEEAAKAINAAAGTYALSVGGFADSVGNAAYNRKLSIRRAEGVKKKLISLGIHESRLSVKSYGESQANVPKRDRWKGRRVEIGIAQKP